MPFRLWSLMLMCLLMALAQSGPPLRALAEKRNFQIGAAVEPSLLLQEPEYARILAQEFNLVVAENVMKWGALQTSRGQYNFALADLLMDFAQKNRMAVRGHTLVWHQQLPRWMYGSFSPAEMEAILREHIQTVVGRYRGRIAYWDVVNEAVGDDAKLRPTPFEVLPDYLEKAFRLAREADPQAKLFYNDYGAEGLGPKSDAIYALLKGLKERGVPLDGVGFQVHVDLGFSPGAVRMAENLERFARLGLEIHITEMDVRLSGPGSRAERLEKQAQVYREVMRVCLGQPRCKAFTLWGFTDAHSWRSASEPLIFDADYKPKPAYLALQQALQRP
ncbi:Endo-1,4-beta-xylanase Z [Meiothermus luteus]|uniref:Beta-xylanase n=1 Tax=Meiothermus luteus TaxID=2026184 RepID=A0A399EQ02_9DEIN|nr:endo-1,4-beta-xylanase [Meiothermus luteus]RIH86744.1 Endo-1,4-beta-xylanase Z [Meiothermus luteus]